MKGGFTDAEHKSYSSTGRMTEERFAYGPAVVGEDPPTEIQVTAIRVGRRAVSEPAAPMPATQAEARDELVRLHNLAPTARARPLTSKASRGTTGIAERIRLRERAIVASFRDRYDEPEPQA